MSEEEEEKLTRSRGNILRDIQKQQAETNAMLTNFIAETKIHRGYQKETIDRHEKEITKIRDNQNSASKHKWIERAVNLVVAALTGAGAGLGSK